MAAQSTIRVYNLGPATDIPLGEGRAYDVADTQVAVFRTRSGEVYATQARCPHRAGPLADGLIGPSTVVCPLHAYAFNLTSGLPQSADCPALTTYPVRVDEAGYILLRLTASPGSPKAGS